MKYPTRLSDAVHILTFIALNPDCDLTSNKLAESVQTNPAYVRQLMSALRKGGLLVSVKGHPRPALAREPKKITLLDAYRAVEGNKPLLHQDIHTNPACGVGVNIQLHCGTVTTWYRPERRKPCAASPCRKFWIVTRKNSPIGAKRISEWTTLNKLRRKPI